MKDNNTAKERNGRKQGRETEARERNGRKQRSQGQIRHDTIAEQC